ncbi:MAG: IS30 family transposase [Candidatus Pacebacteria bacterium]|nr:IS30 family transposase [Candidatus Paceibacterota bacterium]
MKYQHFSVRERERIQRGLWRKESIRYIALQLGRSHSSVIRELKRVVPINTFRYNSRRAQERALVKRKSRGRIDRLKNDHIRLYVIEHLKVRWSPEQIAGRMKRDGVGSISPEAIYQFIYAQIKNGKPRKGCTDLRPYLRHKRKRRVPHGARRSQRVFKPWSSIEDRPKIVDCKKRIGDWEGDTVESRDHKPGINTVLERKTGLVFISKLAGKKSADTARVLARRFANIPQHCRHTITLDRGSENSDIQSIEAATGMRVFHAHAYSAWERGANENVNGLIRDFHPKKTDFTLVPEEDIAAVEYALNTRPRKRLKWRTPLEVWSGALRS